jgi:demethylmenaquinone methyltransferase/2-methoxy-6-polyprenyl-1,4-benzoquinol methylase
MTDIESYIQSLLVTNPLTEPVVLSAIQALHLPSDSCGLDAGCGIGLQTLLLARAIGPFGHVTGLDISPEFLALAREKATEAGLSGHVSYQEGDVRQLPFDDGRFDWVWSANCVGYGPMEPISLLQELARVVKPGGMVVIIAWSSQMLLPGYPLLEARLNATSSGIAPFVRDKRPELHFLRALGWFRQVGLENPTVNTISGQVSSPMTNDLRRALFALFEMRWTGVGAELNEEDLAEYRRLCLPESPDFIVYHPDYYAFFTYSMFCGTVATKDRCYPLLVN